MQDPVNPKRFVADNHRAECRVRGLNDQFYIVAFRGPQQVIVVTTQRVLGTSKLNQFQHAPDVAACWPNADPSLYYGITYWRSIEMVNPSVERVPPPFPGPVKKKVIDSKYPNTCPRCTKPAYVGATPTAVDCSARCSVATNPTVSY